MRQQRNTFQSEGQDKNPEALGEMEAGNLLNKSSRWDFPGGPVVKNPPANAGDEFNPWSGN